MCIVIMVDYKTTPGPLSGLSLTLKYRRILYIKLITCESIAIVITYNITSYPLPLQQAIISSWLNLYFIHCFTLDSYYIISVSDSPKLINGLRAFSSKELTIEALSVSTYSYPIDV